MAYYHPSTEWLRWEGTSREVIYSKPPAQAGSARARCSVLHPVQFWMSPRTEISQSLWATCARALITPQICFLAFKLKFLYFSFGSWPVISGCNKKSLAPSSSHAPAQVFITIDTTTTILPVPHFLFSRLNNPRSLGSSLYDRFFNPFITFPVLW